MNQQLTPLWLAADHTGVPINGKLPSNYTNAGAWRREPMIIRNDSLNYALFSAVVLSSLIGCSGSPDVDCQANGISGSGNVQPCGAGGAVTIGGGTSSSAGAAATGGSVSVEGGSTTAGGALPTAGTSSAGGTNSVGGSSSLSVLGVVQKGPYILGTTVTVQELDQSLNPNGRSFTIRTTDNLGHFSIPSNVASQYVEVIADGYYFDELANNLSSAQLTLSTISDISTSRSIGVNLLTSLSAERERTLVSAGQTYTQARQQAEHEVLTALSFTATPSTTFDHMDLSQAGNDNGLLLAASVLIEGLAYKLDATSPVAELSEILANISSDLAADGTYDDAYTASKLRCVIPATIDTTAVLNNLQARYRAVGASAVVPPFEQFINVPSDCCTEDLKRCVSNSVQTCDDVGRWRATATCTGSTSNCKDGRCEAACTPGASRCSAEIAQTCSNAGTWQDNGTCSWLTPAIVQVGSGGSNDALQIVADSSGNVTAVWDLSDTTPDGPCAAIWTARYTPGQGWGQPTVLSNSVSPYNPNSALGAQIAASAAGEVTVVWQQSQYDPAPMVGNSTYSIFSRRFVANTGWETTPQLLETVGTTESAVNVAYSGEEAVALWQEAISSSLMEVRTSSRQGVSSWSAPQTIPIAADGVMQSPIRLAGNLAGTLAAAWLDASVGYYYSDVRRFSPTTGWSVSQLLGSGSPTDTAFIAMDPNGNVLAAWWNGSSTAGVGPILSSATYSGATGWSPSTTVEQLSYLGGSELYDMASDMDGNFVTAEIGSRDGISSQLWVRRYVNGSGWRGPVALSSSNWQPQAARFAIDPLGNITVVWEQLNPSTQVGEVWVNRYCPARGWGLAERIRSTSNSIYMMPALAVDSYGRTTAIWRENNNTTLEFDVYYARFE